MNPSVRITLFLILFVALGVIVGLIGISYVSEGVQGIRKSINSDFSREMIRSWVGSYRGYIFAGGLFITGGLGYLASAFQMWSHDDSGRKIGLYSGAAIVIAWGIIQGISTGFRNPPPLGSLVAGLVALVLLSQWVSDVVVDDSEE